MSAEQVPGVPDNAAQFARAKRSIPGGVNSPVRAFASVGGDPRFLVSAKGAYVRDVEGREYVDLVGSWGPAILGHAHPAVVDAVQQAAARGMSFGATTPGETELAELIADRYSTAARRPVERIRLVSTGTEAQIVELTLRITLCGFFNRFNDALGIEEEPEAIAAAAELTEAD